jgi:hypothetical protein
MAWAVFVCPGTIHNKFQKLTYCENENREVLSADETNSILKCENSFEK